MVKLILLFLSMICWYGVFFIFLVGIFNICLNIGIWFSVFLMFLGGLGFFKKVNSLLILCSLLILFWFIFIVICFGVLNRLVSIGIEWFLGFLNSRVGFFVCNVWLVILVILR